VSLHPGIGTLSIERLSSADLIEAFAFLDTDPVVNVYLLAVLMRDALTPTRDEFWAARRAGRMTALLMLGTGSGSVLPVGSDVAALERLSLQIQPQSGALPRRFQIIGARAALAPFRERLARQGLLPRLERDQVYMAVERGKLGAAAPLPDLRPAKPEDYDLVFETGARLRAEELAEDPRLVDPAAYARRVEEECRDGFTYVWREGAALRFRASLSARTADAAQISGVYTPPEWRGRGYATRGVAELCRRVFEQSRSACLFVNDFNRPALAVYRKLGFVPLAEWGSAFYDRGR
jgi:RimJ/RimL family protein N-acetyltransferase